MTADTRMVATDALATLGTIIGPNEKRDAIHLAVLPVKAATELTPGQAITCVDGVALADPDGIGIVDPFLPDLVEPGQRFWMIIRPRLITSLRHVWTHPAIPDEFDDGARREQAEAWLRWYCERYEGPDYETLIRLVLSGKATASPMSFHIEGQDATGEIPPEFWDHLEVVTGLRFPERPDIFSCGC